MAKKAVLPYRWEPRKYQINLLDYMESHRKGGRAVAVWHRRSGKDLTAINFVSVEANVGRVGTYYHLLPTYNQARKVVWDGMDDEGRRFLDYFHPDTIKSVRTSDMQITFKNGSVYQLVGANNYDRLVGPNPVGLIMSEFSVSRYYTLAWNYLRPILANNQGWAMFLFTPRGRNHAYELYRMAQQSDTWFSELLTVDDTGVISPMVVDMERQAGMPEEYIQQEFYCSWEAPAYGSYFGRYMDALREQGRIGRVPHRPGHLVHTAWDLGIADSTAIWFFQTIDQSIHVIDYYEMDGLGLEDYARFLDERGKERNYLYGRHFAPHDVSARELGTGMKRIDFARRLGLNFEVTPRVANKMHGIDLARQTLPICWFDEEACRRGIDCLENYRKEWIERLGTWRPKPVHDEYSHGADAFVVLCQGYTRLSGRKQLVKPLDKYDVRPIRVYRPLAM